jgi:3-hydroxyacyl-CoA dehydrogenase
MPKVAIVGAGLIGRAWATVFAGHGWSAALYEPDAATAKTARRHIGRNLRELAKHGLVRNPDRALARVSVAKSLADALDGAEIAQESGPETVEAKQVVFAELDRIADRKTILASSSSFIVASRFTEALDGRSRCLIAHPVNPPHVVPVVELCPAPWTSPQVVSRAAEIYDSVGQVPITVKKEVFGFVLNRLQAVLMAEAFRLVGDGVVSPQDLDKTIRDGLGLRWSFMGPFETIELNAPGGIPDYAARYTVSMSALVADAIGSEPFSRRNVDAVLRQWTGAQEPARIAALSAWRDGRLTALKAHKSKAKRKPDGR